MYLEIRNLVFSDQPVISEGLAPGASQTFSVDGNIPSDANQLILVYKGELGNEKPAAVWQKGAVIGRVLKLGSRIAYSFQADGEEILVTSIQLHQMDPSHIR